MFCSFSIPATPSAPPNWSEVRVRFRVRARARVRVRAMVWVKG